MKSSHTSLTVPIVYDVTRCCKKLPDKYLCCDRAFAITDIPLAEVGLSILLVAHFHIQLLYCNKLYLRQACRKF